MYVGHTKRQVHKWKFLQHALSRYVYNRSLFDTIIIIIIVIIIIIIIIIIITSETGITIYNYKSHRKLVNVKGLKKKID